MKKRIRICGKRCHTARGTRCKCVCLGFYHGKNGAMNRQVLSEMTEEEAKKTLEQHGFKKGETAYIEQHELPLVIEE